MEHLAGRMKFLVDGKRTALCADKPYVRIMHDVSIPVLAGFIVNDWQLARVPDVIISVCSGIRSTRSWKKDEYRFALQRGFTKLFSTTSAWIFTHGYNQGVAKMIGEAVKQEQDRRVHLLRKGRAVAATASVQTDNKSLPEIYLIGIASQKMLRNPESFDRAKRSDGANAGLQVEYEFGDTARQRFDLNPFHTHFVIVNESDYLKTIQLRLKLERHLEHYAASKINYQSQHNSNRSRHNSGDYTSEYAASDEDEDAGLTDETRNGTVNFQPVASASSVAITTSSSTVPMVALFIQGGPLQLDQLLIHLQQSIPCVIIKGSGFMADIVAGVYEDIFSEGAMLDEQELLAVKTDTMAKLSRQFPHELELNTAAMEACFEKISQAMRLSSRQKRTFLTIIDVKLTSDLINLDKFILKALVASQDPDSFDCPQRVRSNLLLTLKWNHVKTAQQYIFQSESWSALKIDRDMFEQALLLNNRESFVNLFLEQNFRVHKYLTHRRLLNLFRRAEDLDFFNSIVRERILDDTPGAPLNDNFILHKLNPLIYQLADVTEFIDVFTLTSNAYGRYREDRAAAERRALLALLVWAIVLNRFNLAVVIWKYCDQPIPTALFASNLYLKMSKLCREIDMGEQLKANGVKFSEYAVDILDIGYRDGGTLAYEVLETHYEEFNDKTPIIMAYEAENRWFLAHPCCQKWLNFLYRGRIDVVHYNLGFLGKFIPESVKIVLSAWLVLPMFIWIRFPRQYFKDEITPSAISNDHGGKKSFVDEEAEAELNHALNSTTSKIIDSWRAQRSGAPPPPLPVHTTSRALGLRRPPRGSSARVSFNVHDDKTRPIAKVTVDESGGGGGDPTQKQNVQDDGSETPPPTPIPAKVFDVTTGLGGSKISLTPSSQQKLIPPISEDDSENMLLLTIHPTTTGDAAAIPMQPMFSTQSVNTLDPNASTTGYHPFPSTKFTFVPNTQAAPPSRADVAEYVRTRRDNELEKLLEQQRRARAATGLTRILRSARVRTKFRFEASIPVWRKVYYLWQAPVTKFWTGLVSYIAFLAVYSLAALKPDCLALPNTKRALHCENHLDGFVWIWMALIDIDNGLRTYRQWHANVPFDLQFRLAEIVFITVGLAAYAVIRTINFAFYDMFSPLVPRIMLLSGLLYFYIRTITVYFPVSRELGPLLIRMKVMVFGALFNFLKLVAPFFFAYMIIMQVALYPDQQLSRGVVSQAFDRSIFSMFLTPNQELFEKAECAVSRFGEGQNRSIGEAWYTGKYSDASCPTSNFWSYFFMIQWFFLYKMIFATLLTALFTSYTLRVAQESELFWKYQRFQLVVDFATRSSLPPPLSIVSHGIWVVRTVTSFIYHAAVSCCWKAIKSRRRRQHHNRFHHSALSDSLNGEILQCDSADCAESKTGRADGTGIGAVYTRRRRYTYPRQLQLFPNMDNELKLSRNIAISSVDYEELKVADYWQVIAREFWRERAAAESDKLKPDKQFSTIASIKDELHAARTSIKRLRKRVVEQTRLLSTVIGVPNPLATPSVDSIDTNTFAATTTTKSLPALPTVPPTIS